MPLKGDMLVPRRVVLNLPGSLGLGGGNSLEVGTGLCAELAQVLQSPENLGQSGPFEEGIILLRPCFVSCYAGYLLNT